MKRFLVMAAVTAVVGAVVIAEDAPKKKQGGPAKKAEAPKPPHVVTIKPKEEPGVKWKIIQVALDANEGCDIADVDGDGKLDVIAGRNWYHNPEWAGRPLRSIEDWNGYVQSNGEHALDVDGDGHVDVISGSFLPTQLYWYQNPGPKDLALGKMWKQVLLAETGATKNEATFLHDIDGDGVPEFIANSWDTKAPLLIWKLHKDAKGQVTATKHTIGPGANGHGMAFGDINGDGREDILVGSGWYERPAGDPLAQEWTFHPWPGITDMHASCPMLVKDLDGDGKNDLVWGKGHDFGLYWWHNEGVQAEGSIKWTEHLIDDTYSQVHALAWADIEGTGKPALIAGMRKYAHNGKDPGDDQPPQIYYYTLTPGTNGQVEFVRHTIEFGHVGVGLQIRTADLNGDGKVDIVVAGKSGTFILLNQGK
jgi:hypothetical protein